MDGRHFADAPAKTNIIHFLFDLGLIVNLFLTFQI